MPTEIISPAPTVQTVNRYASGTLYANFSTSGTIMTFEIIGGSSAGIG